MIFLPSPLARDDEHPWQGYEDVSLPDDCPMDIKTAVQGASSDCDAAMDSEVSKRSYACQARTRGTIVCQYLTQIQRLRRVGLTLTFHLREIYSCVTVVLKAGNRGHVSRVALPESLLAGVSYSRKSPTVKVFCFKALQAHHRSSALRLRPRQRRAASCFFVHMCEIVHASVLSLVRGVLTVRCRRPLACGVHSLKKNCNRASNRWLNPRCVGEKCVYKVCVGPFVACGALRNRRHHGRR